MRTLELNKIPLWLVEKQSQEPLLDDDGFETGEFSPSYSTPTQVNLQMYPAIGKIKDDLFGKDAMLDMISVSTDVILTKDSLLFEVEPSGNYDTTFTYSVSKILKSLNGYAYGLELRVGVR